MQLSGSIQEHSLLSWGKLHDGLLIVAGPCSVESPEQLRATCRQLAATKKVSMLRAGVWKPRSQPGQFEGAGSAGLAWLKEVKRDCMLPVAVEVATPRHVEECLSHEVDALWLGARTTVNPFMVQEISQAIRGTGIPVMVKNPVSPDLRLWMGAIERMTLAGSSRVAAIHRGFHISQQSNYRNSPLWDIPLALRKEMPGLPLLCDPSHIAGHARWLAEVSLTARGLAFDGLMIEVHHHPAKALTDPLQQVTPEGFARIIHEIIHSPDKLRRQKSLHVLREMIDLQDHQLLELLARRLSLSSEVGKQKKQMGEEIVQPQRQKELLADRLKKAAALGLDPAFVEKLVDLLHSESVAIQKESRNDSPGHS